MGTIQNKWNKIVFDGADVEDSGASTKDTLSLNDMLRQLEADIEIGEFSSGSNAYRCLIMSQNYWLRITVLAEALPHPLINDYAVNAKLAELLCLSVLYTLLALVFLYSQCQHIQNPCLDSNPSFSTLLTVNNPCLFSPILISCHEV